MRHIFILTIALLSLILSGCNKASAPSVEADTIYFNGVVWSSHEQDHTFDAIAFRGDRIVYVGNDPDRVVADARVDLAGRFVMPGIIDSHTHFLEGGAGLLSVDLRDAATKEQFISRLVNAADGSPGRWILNGNWDHTLWGGELPHRDWLDADTVDTPIFVMRIDGHMGFANSHALALAGIDERTPDPIGGEIVRDASGRPTGVLKDKAVSMIVEAIPSPTEEELLDYLTAAQSHALSYGMTEVHVMPGFADESRTLQTFQTAHQRGLLKIRVRLYSPISQWQQVAERVAREGRGDALLRWEGVKLFTDGALGSSTAWFHEPYSDDPKNTGFPIISMEELKQSLQGAHAAGLPMALHAIGDRAIDSLLDAVETLDGWSAETARTRIEHFQHPTQAAIDRAARLGIILSVQPYHAVDDGRWAEAKIGASRASTTYPFKGILAAGGLMAFGSDWPVAPLSPFLGMQAAVTRQTIDGANPEGWYPLQKVSVEQALKAYTAVPAYAVGDESSGGALAVGKRADVAILDDDPRRIAPETLRDVTVWQTIINGEVVYRAAE